MVNSFTRAAGAAERVLSLYDLTPDIDPDAGEPVERCVQRWDLAFESVEFHYQMRPETKVLQGMSFRVDEGHVAALVGRSRRRVAAADRDAHRLRSQGREVLRFRSGIYVPDQ